MENDTLSPWHAGEVALQRTVGADQRLGLHGHRIFRDHLNDQHRRFYPQLPFLVTGTVDADGNAWAGLLSGKPGFARSADPRTLSIAATLNADDPATAGIVDGTAIALLGIELHTRRRNRLNGIVRNRNAGDFDVVVEQAYGNCPQYIQLRDFSFVRDAAEPSPASPQILKQLDERARAIITGADTFFVASYIERQNGHREVDVSHRGGKPGFVRLDESCLIVPDYPGNQFFNTLGNILKNPRTGLVFVDFSRGDLLQLSGDATIVLESAELETFAGAERLWKFLPRRIVYRPDALPLRWEFEPGGWAPELSRLGR